MFPAPARRRTGAQMRLDWAGCRHRPVWRRRALHMALPSSSATLTIPRPSRAPAHGAEYSRGLAAAQIGGYPYAD